MKNLIFLSMFLCAASLCAQVKVPDLFNKSGTYKLKKLHKNDTILILCDTVYLVNRPLYLVYCDLYSRQENIRQVMTESSEIFQNHITEQEKQYELLNNEYHQTQLQFSNYQLVAAQNMESMQINLQAAEMNLRKSMEENDKLKELLEKDLRKSNSQKYFFGIAGISLGIILGLLVR